MTVITFPVNSRTLNAVKAAINVRAANTNTPDDVRRSAISKAFGMIRNGSSPAWAVSEVCRMLRGPAPYWPTPSGDAA